MFSSSSCQWPVRMNLHGSIREGIVLNPSRVFNRPLTPLKLGVNRGLYRTRLRSSNGEQFSKKWKQTKRAEILWDGFDLLSVGGTVGGALLVLLGYDIMLVALPIGFPLVSLFVGIRREREKMKMREEFDNFLIEDLSRQREALGEVKTEIDSLSTEVKSLLQGRLTSFENKLNQIEGTIVTTSRNVQKTASGLSTLPGILKRISEMQQKTVIYAVSTEFRSLFEKWGQAQLQAINQISQRITFIEESLSRLESYESIPGTSTYALPDGDTANDMVEKAEELKSAATGILVEMKDVLTEEISSVVGQLKDNQVDMMQSFRDVKMNPVPQVDYSSFAGQLEKIENALKDLPNKMSETFESNKNDQDLRDSYAQQYNSVSSVLSNLELAIDQLKKATVKGQSALEMESLETKWQELRSLMHSLGEKISGVNDRVEQIVTNPNAVQAKEISMEEYLQFQKSSEPPVSETKTSTSELSNEPPDEEQEDDKPGWEVVDSVERNMYSEITPRSEEQEDKIPEDATYEYSTNGVGEDAIEEAILLETEAESSRDSANGDVSTVGNMKLGLELLKKGRVALDEDYGEAYKYLVRALEQFESILEVDPSNVRCLGNCGNTLLALGELKLGMSKDLQKQEKDKTPSTSDKAAEQLQQEAQEFLVLAGRRFKSLLEIKEDDNRAYMNWGKALCIRARLSEDPVLKMQMYDAAIVKYEKVLTFTPDFATAMFFCGVALKESAEVPIGSPMDMRNRISQAIVYFEDVERIAPSSPLQFEAFQMKQQCFQSAQSPTIMY